jgi:hypothetical protein
MATSALSLPVLLGGAVMSTGTIGSAPPRAYISGPPLQPGRVVPFPRRPRRFSATEPGEDSVIRALWRLKYDGQVTEAAASELHDALVELREARR